MACWRSGLTHQPFTLAFTGSNPVHVIFQYGAVVQMVRMPACHAGGRGFDSHLRRSLVLYAGVAQLAEQLICNQQVAGSSPITGFMGV